MKKLTNLVIRDTEAFNRVVKKLKKQFRNIEKDYTSFVNSIENEADLGTHLRNGIYKVRIANSDKQSGKSSGYRLLSYLRLVENELYLLYIYDKSDFETLSEHEIDELTLSATNLAF